MYLCPLLGTIRIGVEVSLIFNSWNDEIETLEKSLHGPAHKVGTLFSYADDLHSGGILQVIHTRDCPVRWSASLYSIRPRSQVYNSFMGEFPASLGDTVDDENNFSSPYKRSVIKDHPDVRGHATSVHFES